MKLMAHEKLRSDPAMFALAAKMGWNEPECVGRLMYFWWWCGEHAENGDLHKYDADILAMAMRVPIADSKKLIDAMISCGWIVQTPHYSLPFHWWKLNKDYWRKKYQNKPDEFIAIQNRYENKNVNPPPSPEIPDAPNNPPPSPEIPDGTISATAVIDQWNEFAATVKLPRVEQLTNKRRTAITARFAEKGFDLDKIFAAIRVSEFLQGRAGRESWSGATFDFVFCSANNWIKIIEGTYANKPTANGDGKYAPAKITDEERLKQQKYDSLNRAEGIA